jgi:hypothetical protein
MLVQVLCAGGLTLGEFGPKFKGNTQHGLPVPKEGICK